MKTLQTSMVLLLSACSPAATLPTPDARVVDDLEAKLAKLPCISPLSQWERNYETYSRPQRDAPRRRDYDTSRISFTFYQAGYAEHRRGRVIHTGWMPRGIDDNVFRFAYGEYSVPAKSGVVTGCGTNIGPGDSPHIEVLEFE